MHHIWPASPKSIDLGVHRGQTQRDQSLANRQYIVARLPILCRVGYLRNVPKQKQGTIDVYDFKTDQIDDDEPVTVKIAVQLCENSGKNSKMIFGKAAPMITGGHWKTEEHAHLPKPVRKYSEVWSVVIEAVNFKFLAQVLYDPEGGGLIWYVQPKTTEIQPGTRVITDKLDTDPLHTVGYALSPEESELFDIMLRQRKVFFSDNQTGTDFYECLKKTKT